MSKFILMGLVAGTVLASPISILAQANAPQNGISLEDTNKVKRTKIIIIDKDDSKDTIQFFLPGKETFEDDQELDTNGEKKVKKKKVEKSFMTLDLGVNGYTSNDKIELPVSLSAYDLKYPNSISFGFTQHYSQPIIGQWMRFAYGWGFDFNSYRFNNDVLLSNVGDTLRMNQLPTDNNLSKSKLTAAYFQVPALLHFKINPHSKNAFNILAGVEGSALVGSKTKQVYEINGDKKKEKNRGGYDLSPLRYSYVARIGNDKVAIFGKYTPVSMFQSAQNPSFNQFNVGITIGGI